MSALRTPLCDLLAIEVPILQAGMGRSAEALASFPWLAKALHPDRWMLWMGILFIVCVYYIPTGIDEMPEQIESRYVQILKAVKSVVQIPVAVKLSPYFTNVAAMARQLDQAGANGLVLNSITLSTRADTRLALHWIALLSRHLKANLAATGGIHTAEDVVKMLMVGAKVTMMTSVLLK